MTVADRLRDIAAGVNDAHGSHTHAETELLELADELDGGDIHLESNPWGLVIDQVVGLAAVYDIDPRHPTTPEQVHDLWREILPRIATAATMQGWQETEHLRAAADQWHLLTEALALDLRVDGVSLSLDDDAKVWRQRVRDALWMAYGIGRRHQRNSIECAGSIDRTPFETPRNN